MSMILHQYRTMTRLTALEVLRQPVCLLILISCVAVIALLPFVITHTLGDGDKLIRDSALAMQFVCGLLLGGYAACSTLAHEIRRGTASAILSKPVGRSVFLLSKFSGVAVVLCLFGLCTTLTAILSTRVVRVAFHPDWWAGGPLLAALPIALGLAALVNYKTRKPFSSTAAWLTILTLLAVFILVGFIDPEGKPGAFGAFYFWPLVPAALLITLALIVLAALAVGLATRLDVVPTLSICGAVFFLGLISDYLLARPAAHSFIARAAYAVLPNWQHFWLVDALNRPEGIPWAYVGLAMVYAVVYLTGVLSLGLLAFRNMDIR